MATSTARQVINAAMKRLGLLSEEETATAPQMVDGLVTLNQMLHGFNGMGIAYVHVDLTLDGVLNLPDEQVRNVILMLADELADPYGKTVSDKLRREIVDAHSTLQAFYNEVPPAQVDPGVDARLSYGGYLSIDRF